MGIRNGLLIAVPFWVFVAIYCSGCGMLTSKGVAFDTSFSLHAVDEHQQSSKMDGVVRAAKCIFVQCPETSNAEQGS